MIVLIKMKNTKYYLITLISLLFIDSTLADNNLVVNCTTQEAQTVIGKNKPTEITTKKDFTMYLTNKINLLLDEKQLDNAFNTRVSTSPTDLENYLKSVACLMLDYDFNNKDIQPLLTLYSEQFKIQYDLALMYGPLLTTVENGGVLNEDSLEVLLKHKELIAQLRLIDKALRYSVK
jgi:hypothetical protein